MKNQKGIPTIQDAELGDALEISTMMAQSWKSAYKNIVSKEYLQSLSNNHWESFLNETITSSVNHCIVLKAHNIVVGTSVFGESITDDYSGEGEIIAIYLSPKYYGLQYGRLLMNHSESRLKDMGYKHLVICVFSENTRAIRFYESCGLEQISKNHLTQIGQEELQFTIMRKLL